MRIIIWFSVFISLGILVYLVDISNLKKEREYFTVTTVEENIIDTYKALLQRSPTAVELLNAKNNIKKGTMTFEDLKNRLIQTDEYLRIVKAQSNSLTPEMTRMMSDEYIINKITDLYKAEVKKTIPKDMIYPLKDIYVDILDFNEFSLRAMLRDAKYQLFEKEIQFTRDVNYDLMVDIFDKYFDRKELKIIGNNIKTLEGYNIIKNEPLAPSLNKEYRKIDNNDMLFTQYLIDKIIDGESNKKSSNIADTISDIIKANNNNNTCTSATTKEGHMVLDPSLAWSVPQEHPPVCTTLGQPPQVKPLMNDSKLLLGTPLDDAKNTQVGSIMPKFEYKEFVGNCK